MARVSFTGTRKGLTAPQRTRLHHLLYELGTVEDLEWHDGDCVGADAEAHEIVQQLKRDVAPEGHVTLIGHPGNMPSLRAGNVFDEMREVKENLVRNHDMVDEVEILVACPGEMMETRRSGTWSTIRYARRLIKAGVKLHIFFAWPDGTLTKEPTSA